MRRGGLGAGASAPRAAGGLGLLCLELLLRWRRGPLRGRGAAARGHGLHRRGRRRGRGRPRGLPRARGHGRRLPRAGNLSGAHRVLWRRDRSRAPHGSLDRPDHRRAGLRRGGALPRDGLNPRGHRTRREGALQPCAERRQGRGRPRGNSVGCRAALAREVPPGTLRWHGQSHRAHLQGRPRGPRRAARSLR